MRQIKFRAWLIKENELVIPSSVHWNKGYGNALEIFVDNPKFEPYRDFIKNPDSKILPFFTYINHSLDVHKKRNEGDDFILEQFTGAMDKNGKEIYDGDIVKYSNSREWGIGVMEEFCNCFGIMWSEQHTKSPSIFTTIYYLNCASELEVIGNIHQNKDLL